MLAVTAVDDLLATWIPRFPDVGDEDLVLIASLSRSLSGTACVRPVGAQVKVPKLCSKDAPK